MRELSKRKNRKYFIIFRLVLTLISKRNNLSSAKTYFNSANYIKSIIIDTIFKKLPDFTIGNEVQFGEKGSFADLILLNDKKIIAYEIKAKNDDLRSLRSQLNYYKNVFDFVYIVITDNHLNKVLPILKEDEGLIVINSASKCDIYKEAKLIINNNKEEILASMRIKFISSYFNLKNSSAKQMRLSIKDKDLEELKNAYYTYLYKKLNPKTHLFLSECGEKTHFEEIFLLSYNERSQLL